MVAKWAKKHDKFTETDSVPVFTFFGNWFLQKAFPGRLFSCSAFRHSGFKACFLVLSLGFLMFWQLKPGHNNCKDSDSPCGESKPSIRSSSRERLTDVSTVYKCPVEFLGSTIFIYIYINVCVWVCVSTHPIFATKAHLKVLNFLHNGQGT